LTKAEPEIMLPAGATILQSPTIEENKPQEENPTASEAENEKQKGFLFSFTDKVLTGLLGTLPVAIIVNHFSTASWSLYIAAGALCAFLLWRTRNRGIIRFVVTLLCALLMLGTHSYVKFESGTKYVAAPTVPPSARFKIVLKTLGVSFELTNSLMRFSGLPIATKPVFADLVLPAKSITDLPSLELRVINDSDVYSDSIQVDFGWGADLAFEAGPPWFPTERLGEDDSGMHFVARNVDPIFPHNGIELPPLRLKSCPAISNKAPTLCMIQITPKDRKDSFWAFALFVPITTNATGPRIAFATNGILMLPFK